MSLEHCTDTGYRQTTFLNIGRMVVKLNILTMKIMSKKLKRYEILILNVGNNFIETMHFSEHCI